MYDARSRIRGEKGDPAAIGYYGFKDSVLKANLEADKGRRYPTISSFQPGRTWPAGAG
jgi:hypothetical protein